MEKQVKLFLDFLKDDKKLSDNTLQSYRRDIEQYEKYVSDNKINYLKVTEETILEYMEYLREENKKESTISRSLASIRSFYQYLIRVKKIKVLSQIIQFYVERPNNDNWVSKNK